MLQQHLVVIVSADGAVSHHPIVCRASEIFGHARRLFDEIGGHRAEVWRGAQQLYWLGGES